MNPVVHREIQHINAIFALVDSLPYDDETLAHWARYLCVLTCGLFERCLAICLSAYVDSAANPRVAKYAKSELNRITNINKERLLQILGSFNGEWRAACDDNISDEHKDAIDSILANRHSIVHGRSVGITMPRVRSYCERVVEIIEWIDKNCGTST